MSIRFSLGWPPSVNSYYKRVLRGVVINEKGKAYRRDAAYALKYLRNSFTAEQRLMVTINAFPPNKRAHDLDNILKCLLDSIEYAGVFPDDKQIDYLTVIRRDIVKGGEVQVWISECSSSE